MLNMRPDGPRVAVIGAGGVGGYLGGRLAAAGYDVRFLARGKNLAALEREGLRVSDGTSGWSIPKVRATADPRDIGEVDFALLCVKSPQLPAAVTAISPLIGADTAVVTVQNGVEAPEQVAERIGRGRVLPGAVRIVATMVGPGEIRHAGPADTVSVAEWDGSTSARVRWLRETLGDAGVATPEPADIWVDLWMKFLLVVPIGSLGAVTGGATVGELRSRTTTRRMLIAGMREIYETGTRLGIALPPYAVDTATALMDRQAADATTSLQRDILARRPSEVEAWTGSAVRLASRIGADAPTLQMLYDLLTVWESRVTCRS